MDRPRLAARVASGLAGWLQLHAAQELHELHGEDTAQFTLSQILYSCHQWRIEPSAKPPNWRDDSKHRVDLALRPWSEDAKSWYGAIEVKWPGAAIDRAKERRRLLHDVLRVTSVKTDNFNAAFVVVGGSVATIAALFDTPGDPGASEEQRVLINGLLRRDTSAPDGSMESADVDRFDTDTVKWRERVPADPPFVVNNRIWATLLAEAKAHVGGVEVGRVFVWDCTDGTGRRAGS